MSSPPPGYTGCSLLQGGDSASITPVMGGGGRGGNTTRRMRGGFGETLHALDMTTGGTNSILRGGESAQIVGVRGGGRGAAGTKRRGRKGKAAAALAKRTRGGALPAGWEALQNSSQQDYYIHDATNTSQYTYPDADNAPTAGQHLPLGGRSSKMPRENPITTMRSSM